MQWTVAAYILFNGRQSYYSRAETTPGTSHAQLSRSVVVIRRNSILDASVRGPERSIGDGEKNGLTISIVAACIEKTNPWEGSRSPESHGDRLFHACTTFLLLFGIMQVKNAGKKRRGGGVSLGKVFEWESVLFFFFYRYCDINLWCD